MALTVEKLRKRAHALHKVQHYEEGLRVAELAPSVDFKEWSEDLDLRELHLTLFQHVHSNWHYFVGERASRSTSLLHMMAGQWRLTQEVLDDIARWNAFIADSRASVQQAAFIYLLIDCRIIGADPTRCSFSNFVSSVFYVGKGNGNRPLDHLREAQRTSLAVDPLCSEKIRKIREVMSTGEEVGILRLHKNQNDLVAFTIEHAMIEAFGEGLLTNFAEGHSHLGARAWSRSTRENIGKNPKSQHNETAYSKTEEIHPLIKDTLTTAEENVAEAGISPAQEAYDGYNSYHEKPKNTAYEAVTSGTERDKKAVETGKKAAIVGGTFGIGAAVVLTQFSVALIAGVAVLVLEQVDNAKKVESSAISTLREEELTFEHRICSALHQAQRIVMASVVKIAENRNVLLDILDDAVEKGFGTSVAPTAGHSITQRNKNMTSVKVFSRRHMITLSNQSTRELTRKYNVGSGEDEQAFRICVRLP